MSDKLPKQIKHWLRKAGLRRPNRLKHALGHSWRTKKEHDHVSSYKGKGCWWRIIRGNNGHYYIQVGEVYGHFDRWANSSLRTVKLPSNYVTLKKIVDNLARYAEEHYYRAYSDCPIAEMCAPCGY